MKKLSILLVAAIAMISCGNSYNVKTISLNNQNDSMNYAIGCVNGHIVQSQLLMHDMSKKEVSEIMQAIDQGYKSADESQAADFGRNIGSYIQDMKENGINNNPTWPVNLKLMLQGLTNGMLEDTTIISHEEANRYFMSKMEAAPVQEDAVGKPINGKMNTKFKKVTLNNELDSINYTFGLINGYDLVSYLKRSSDDIEKDIKEVAKGVNEALDDEAINPRVVGMSRSFGKQLKSDDNTLLGFEGLTLDLKVLKQGMANAMLQDTIMMQPMEAQLYIDNFFKQVQEKEAQEAAAQYKEENADRLAAEEQFLAENAQKEGVIVTESGLQYKVIKQGKGAKPKAMDRVKVHYHGTLLDGTVFDSSVDRGEPITFGLNQVIAGWTEGLQLMPVGSKYVLYIPYQLGYGDRDMGQIPPYSLLIFEVELLDIEKESAL